jgi:hypothetical protein
MASPEQKKSYKVVRQFKGLNTKALRTAIDEDEFSWVENAQPVGAANLKIIPTYSNATNATGTTITWSNTVTTLAAVNLGVNDYIVGFQSNGAAQYYNVTTSTFGNVAAAGKFSNSGITFSQWNNDRMLICDPVKGYFTWDGNNTVTVGAIGYIGITAVGTGYNAAPTVTISGPDETGGTQANAVAIFSTVTNTITSVLLTNGGTGYTNGANVKITFTGGNGTGATAIAGITSFAQGTLSFSVVSGGNTYANSTNTTIAISGGGGTGAVANAIITANAISQIIMTNNGTGYTNAANIVVTISGTGGNSAVLQPFVQTNTNTGIASFSGRVWLAQGRTVFYTAAGYYGNFTATSAGSILLTDSTLHGNIQQLVSANNFLYIFGDDSINIFSDVRVTSTGSTIFTNTNVSASVGSKRPYAIIPYFRSILFMNDYGVYALVGSTTSKLSDALDGMIPNINFAQPIYAGQVLLNNILCAAFNFQYYDGLFSNSYRYIQAVFFDKKWFLTSQGNNLAYIVSVPIGGKINLFGTDGTTLYRLYNDSSNSISSIVQTALLPMEDSIRTKQALKIAIEATNSNYATTLNTTVDSEIGSSPSIALTSTINWLNNANQIVTWTNNSLATVAWGGSGFLYLKSDAQQYGKYLGMTVKSSSPLYVLNGFEFEHELRTRF